MSVVATAIFGLVALATVLSYVNFLIFSVVAVLRQNEKMLLQLAFVSIVIILLPTIVYLGLLQLPTWQSKQQRTYLGIALMILVQLNRYFAPFAALLAANGALLSLLSSRKVVRGLGAAMATLVLLALSKLAWVAGPQ